MNFKFKIIFKLNLKIILIYLIWGWVILLKFILFQNFLTGKFKLKFEF